jgi:hypothetical protein
MDMTLDMRKNMLFTTNYLMNIRQIEIIKLFPLHIKCNIKMTKYILLIAFLILLVI